VIRFKPDCVMFGSSNSFRTIYQTRANVKKGGPGIHRTNNTLSTVDKLIHARKRRVLNSAFTDKAICSSEESVKTHVNRWNELMIGDNHGKICSELKNMSDLIDYLVFDLMVDSYFGKSCELKEPGPD
jgi:cytochrome P450